MNLFYICIPTINRDIIDDPFIILNLSELKNITDELTIYCVGIDYHTFKNFIYEVKL